MYGGIIGIFIFWLGYPWWCILKWTAQRLWRLGKFLRRITQIQIQWPALFFAKVPKFLRQWRKRVVSWPRPQLTVASVRLRRPQWPRGWRWRPQRRGHSSSRVGRVPVQQSAQVCSYDWIDSLPGSGLVRWWALFWFHMWWRWQAIRLFCHRPWRSIWLQWRAWSVLSFQLLVVMGIGLTLWFGVWWVKALPSPELLRERRPIVSTKIYDRNGILLYKVFEDENRTVVPLTEISPHLVQATLAIEDTHFYEHWGVSVRGVMRAFVHNLQSDSTHGGSTVTQQLVKNTLLSTERTWERKIKEAVLAVAVDYFYTKEEILAYYLNEVNYGGAIYGAEEASQWYFGKPARDLTLAESALLAGLPQRPSAYSPYGSYPEQGLVRQREVLAQMEAVGYITPQQRQEAEQETMVFRPATFDIIAPHFVMFIQDQLSQQFGEAVMRQGGLEVYTTLDVTVQASAEAAVAHELDRLQRLRVSNGAAMVTNPKTGEVLAMVGSHDYFDIEHDGQVNVTLRERQPGSSIKPVTYATAFERGFRPSSTIEDSPVTYTAAGSPPYSPKNYDGRFHGRVTLREALASSYNIPAVRLLAEVGIETMVAKARAMGITTWNDSSRFGLALTLGGGEVTMYDMAQVYGTFANGGQTVPLNPIVSVTTYDGKELYRNPCANAQQPCNGRQVLSPLTAYQITSVLSDNSARTPAFGPRSVLHIPDQEVAVKTGTTNSLRDNWTIGYTNDRVVLTWVGNNDNTPMSAVASGVTGASPIWNSIMKAQLSEMSSPHRFALPPQLERVAICASTGTLACNGCPNVVQEVFQVGHAPTARCSPEWFANNAQPATQEKPTAQRP